MVARLHATIIRVTPHHSSHFATTLGLLASDPIAAIRFGDQLVIGWEHYSALVSGTADPAITSRGRETWRAWSQRARGERLRAEPSHAEVVRAGYVMRIGRADDVCTSSSGSLPRIKGAGFELGQSANRRRESGCHARVGSIGRPTRPITAQKHGARYVLTLPTLDRRTGPA